MGLNPGYRWVITVWTLLITKDYAVPSTQRRMGNFLPEGTVNRLAKKLSQVAQVFTKQYSTKRNEGHTMQQHRAYWHMRVAWYSFSGSTPSKFEHKLCRHKQTFGKITTTVVLFVMIRDAMTLNWSCHSNKITPLLMLSAIHCWKFLHSDTSIGSEWSCRHFYEWRWF